MIVKSFELGKINFEKGKVFLFYGKNEGLKREIIDNKRDQKKIVNYEEKTILEDKENFLNNFLSNSFFEEEKIIVINRATDKILPIIEEIVDNQLNDEILIINSEILEKKSKLRKFFETDKKNICVPFYEDNYQTLLFLAQSFFKNINLKISNQNINIIIERAKNDRVSLKNELEKIECYTYKKKTIERSEILKLTNLAENYNISELTNQCLAKNKKKTLSILNENNHTSEDNILILRNFLYKLKRLRKLKKELEIKKDFELTISSFKPAIFWKDKTIVKQQLQIWSLNQIKSLIKKVNYLELQMKKKSQISNHIVNNFILEKLEISNN